MDVRIASPQALWPRDEIVELARAVAAETGAQDHDHRGRRRSGEGRDFLLTDVWVSMGEPDEVWAERIELLMPYQVNAEAMATTGNPDVKFMHCLPAFHNTETQVGKEIYEKFGMDCARGDRGGLRVAGVARVRRGREPDAHDQGRDGRDARELMRIVVALGGNALLRRGEPLTAENQRANARPPARRSRRSRSSTSSSSRTATGRRSVCSRSRGRRTRTSSVSARPPRRADRGDDRLPDPAGAGQRAAAEKRLASLLTLIEVDPADPAFGDPTKPIGPIYTEDEATSSRGRRAGRSSPTATVFRRVVASPLPQRIFGLEPIEWLLGAAAS